MKSAGLVHYSDKICPKITEKGVFCYYKPFLLNFSPGGPSCSSVL